MGSGTVKGLLIRLIRLYQRLISPHLPAACRFYPSCSQYAIEALEQYGLLRGLALSSWRILKCHPFHPGGYDPVKQPLTPHYSPITYSGS